MSDPFDYIAARNDADSLLADFGQPVLIRRTALTGTPWEPTQAITDYPTIGAIVNLKRWYPSFADNSDVLRTDRLGYVSMGPLNALGIVPTPFDVLVNAAAVVFRIIDAKPIYPGGLPVLYILQLRS